MRRLLLPALLLALSTSACAAPTASRGAPTTTPLSPPTAEMANPTSLEEALARAGLVRFEPTLVSREMTHDMGSSTRVEGRRVTMSVSAGWSAQTPIFARGDDGRVVLVDAQPHTIVDRHVNGGCRHFFGGRMWFETHVYELPEGSSFVGSLPVRWDDHIEVVDYTATEADGSACPPPAID
ncbi:MAG: hypothetical protein J0L92_33585 [Deltaproteobacteria bacterium]|nr:hypothetical protein [Deltaproteobacteria bacterium]